MYFAVIFRGIFWLGIAIAIASLFVPLELFFPILGLGLVSIAYALYEQHLMKTPFLQPNKLPSPMQTTTQPKQLPVTKTLRLPSTPKEPKKGWGKRFAALLSKLKHPFKKQPKQQEPTIKHDFLAHTPQFEKIKHLFQENVKLTKPGTQQAPQPLRQLIAKKFSKTPLKPTAQPFDWESEQHYIPEGAEDIKPDTEDRYAVSAVPDERYLEKAKLQPPPLQPPTKPTQLVPLKEEQPAPENTTGPKVVVSHEAPKAESVSALTAEELGEDDLEKLKKYVENALKAHHPPERIKAAALKAGWPKKLVEEAFKGKHDAKKKKKLIILGGLVVALLVFLVILNSMDFLLIGDLVESLQYASLTFYLVAGCVILLTVFILFVRMKKMLKTKKVFKKQEQAEHVKEIKAKLHLEKGGYETDFDRLYALIKDRKKITLSEVAEGFGIKRVKAEEWGKILKEQGLIDIYYPTVGEPELQWKK